MFKILHKCSPLDPDSNSQDYAILLGQQNGEPVTRVLCSKCRESMYILGRDFFDSAQYASDRQRAAGQPGFIGAGRTD